MPQPVQIDLSAYREGQQGAHTVILERLINQESYTTIVLPCGYGKTDVIRTVSLEAWSQHAISSALILNPNVILRDQIVAPAKMQAWMDRYQIATTVGPLRVKTLRSPVPNFTANDEFLVSTTIALVQRNLDFFVQWVEYQRHHFGIPPLICIDEAQTESVENTWGQAVIALVNAGALALLITATPLRSDEKPIPGFPCEEIDSQDEIARIYQRTADPAIREQLIYAARRITWRLLPDYEVTFSEAWAQNHMAAIDRFPFDVQVEELSSTVHLPSALFSTIPGYRVDEYLGKLVREPSVMREGVKIFCEALNAIKQHVSECAGMIFVSNDTDKQGMVNAHANAVAKLIRDYAPHWTVLIATSSDGDQAIDDLQRFANEDQPHGDILIVKQMAARGLDTPRCKVLLDLSPMRAKVGWIQRIMRINRLYKDVKGVYIAPDDIRSRALFEDVVHLSGGGTTESLEIGALLEHNFIQITPSDQWRTICIEEMAPADFSDSQGFAATAVDHPVVRHLYNAIPALTISTTRAELATALNGWTPPSHYQAIPPEDTSVLAKDERDSINTVLRNIAFHRVGPPANDQTLFGNTMSQIWIEVKHDLGIPQSVQFGTIDDLALLAHIKRHVTIRQQQERH